MWSTNEYHWPVTRNVERASRSYFPKKDLRNGCPENHEGIIWERSFEYVNGECHEVREVLVRQWIGA